MGMGNLHIAIGYLQLNVPFFSLWPLILLVLYTLLTAPFMLHPICTNDSTARHSKIYTTILYFLSLGALFVYVGLMNFDLTRVGFPPIESSASTLIPHFTPVEPAGVIGLFLVFLGFLSVFDKLFAKSAADKKPTSLSVSAVLGLIVGIPLFVLVLLYEGLNSFHFFYYVLGLFILYLFVKYRDNWLGKIILFIGLFITAITLYLPAGFLFMGGLPFLYNQVLLYKVLFLIIPSVIILLYLFWGRRFKTLNTCLAVIGIFGLTSMALFIYLYNNDFLYTFAYIFYVLVVSIVYLIWRGAFNYFDGQAETTHASLSLLATWVYLLIAAFFMVEFLILHPYHDIINCLNQGAANVYHAPN